MPFKEARPPAKYLTVQRVLREEIAAGGNVPGRRLASEKDLAARFGVSHMTVRRAMDGLVEEGLLERRAGAGTFVRSGRRGRNLGLLSFRAGGIDAGTLAWSELQSLHDAARSGGREVRAMSLLRPFPPAGRIVEDLRRMDVGAVGVYGFRNRDRGVIARIASAMPCLLLNKELPGLALPCAKPDLLSAADQAVEHLLARGCRHIGAAVVDVEHSQQQELLQAVATALARRGLPINKRYWFEGVGLSCLDEARRWAESLADGAGERLGLVVDEDISLLSPVRAGICERLARRGPQGVELVELCDMIDHRASPRPWPVLEIDYVPVMAQARRMLLEMLEGRLEGAPVVTSPVRLLLPAQEPDGGSLDRI